METNALPNLRRIDQHDIDGVNRALADGYRSVGMLYEYQRKIITRRCVGIRAGKISDIGACTEIALAELRDSRLYSDPEIPFDVAQEEYSRRVAWAFDNSTVLVAIVEEKIVGFVSLRENRIDLIAVSKGYSRRGIGTRLMEHCINECIVAGYDRICAATQGSNQNAHRFYEHLGFDCVMRVKDFHK